MVTRPVCFVVMPYHSVRMKARGQSIDFDRVYTEFIKPAVEGADLFPFRADEEDVGGIFQRTMFERLALCEYAVVDMSTRNPNVFYELGIRHAIRPWSTALLFNDQQPLPLDVAHGAAIEYPVEMLDDPVLLAKFQNRLVKRLQAARQREVDSPVHQLITGLPVMELDHRRVDIMREHLDSTDRLNEAIERAEQGGLAELRSLRDGLGALQEVSSENLLALLTAFRAVRGWQEMVDLVDAMPAPLVEIWMVREQFALALGRLGEFRRATTLLQGMADERPNPETLGLLGGVFKRQWLAAVESGQGEALCRGILNRACDAYKRGFDLDFRDTFTGGNALLLLTVAGRDEEATSIGAVVEYAAAQRLSSSNVEYWDHASWFGVNLTRGDYAAAAVALPALLASMDQPFQAETTAADIDLMLRYVVDEKHRAAVKAMRDQILDQTANV